MKKLILDAKVLNKCRNNEYKLKLQFEILVRQINLFNNVQSIFWTCKTWNFQKSVKSEMIK